MRYFLSSKWRRGLEKVFEFFKNSTSLKWFKGFSDFITGRDIVKVSRVILNIIVDGLGRISEMM